MSDRVTWESCPSCGRIAAVGWTAIQIAVSILKPGPIRTVFLRNAGGLTRPAADPYAALLGSYNGTMTAACTRRVRPQRTPATSSRRSRRSPPGPRHDPRPGLRYQSSTEASVIVSRKLVDPTGDSIIAATSGLLHEGVQPAHAAAGSAA